MILALLVLGFCACAADPKTDSTQTTTDTGLSGGSGLEDSIFDETGTQEGSGDKSFTASVPVTPQDSADTPADTTGDTSETVVGTTGNTGSTAGPDISMTYEEFEALTPAEQRAFQESFSDIELFFDWYDAAKAKYEEENPPIEIGGGTSVTLPT